MCHKSYATSTTKLLWVMDEYDIYVNYINTVKPQACSPPKLFHCLNVIHWIVLCVLLVVTDVNCLVNAYNNLYVQCIVEVRINTV